MPLRINDKTGYPVRVPAHQLSWYLFQYTLNLGGQDGYEEIPSVPLSGKTRPRHERDMGRQKDRRPGRRRMPRGGQPLHRLLPQQRQSRTPSTSQKTTSARSSSPSKSAPHSSTCSGTRNPSTHTSTAPSRSGTTSAPPWSRSAKRRPESTQHSPLFSNPTHSTETAAKRITHETPPNTGRTPKNTRKLPTPTIQAIQ